MLFWLKKTIAYCLMPLSVCIALMIAGLWLMRRRPHQSLGRWLVIAGVLLLLLFSNNQVSMWLMRPLEAEYPAIPELALDALPSLSLGRCRYVVVLGGGNSEAEYLPANSKLSVSALARVTEGVRLLRILPEARLVVSGPAAGKHPSHASVLAQAAVALGIAPDRIIKIDSARDTEDESNAVRQLIGDAPVALVTSAWHLPRAVTLFRHAGVDVLPCPADFLAKNVSEWRVNDFLCEPEGLTRSTYAVREYIGRLWIWLRGKG